MHRFYSSRYLTEMSELALVTAEFDKINDECAAAITEQAAILADMEKLKHRAEKNSILISILKRKKQKAARKVREVLEVLDGMDVTDPLDGMDGLEALYTLNASTPALNASTSTPVPAKTQSNEPPLPTHCLKFKNPLPYFEAAGVLMSIAGSNSNGEQRMQVDEGAEEYGQTESESESEVDEIEEPVIHEPAIQAAIQEAVQMHLPSRKSKTSRTKQPKWTHDERVALADIVKEGSERTWDEVAQLLTAKRPGTFPRTGAACSGVYREYFNTKRTAKGLDIEVLHRSKRVKEKKSKRVKVTK